jgi:hypothetical protein
VTPENAGEAQHSFEQALAMDPESVDARVGIATVFTDNVINKPSFRAKRASGVGENRKHPISSRSLCSAPRAVIAATLIEPLGLTLSSHYWQGE